jgi:lipopolysaccharide export system permease protein
MKLLDRYVTRELLGPFVFGVAAFTLIFLSGQYLFKLTSMVAQGAPLLDVIELLALHMVPLAILTFPMATLLATLLSFGRLSGDMEVVAMMAAGVSFVRIAVPAFVMGVLVSMFGLFANEVLVPPAGRAVKRTEARIAQTLGDQNADIAPAGGRSFIVPDYEGGELARLVVAGGFDFAARRLDRVTYLEFGGPGGPGRHVVVMVEAEHAYWNPQERDHWVFENGFTHWLGERHPGTTPTGNETYHSSYSFVRQTFQLKKTPRQIAAEGQDPESMSYQELSRYITNLRDQGASLKTLRDLELNLYNKLSVPFTSMVFALIGAPLGLRRLRGGAAVGLGVSILIIFCYYVLWHGTSVLGDNGQLPPVVASWLANMVGLGVGGALVVNAAN